MNKWNNKFRYQVASCWLFILNSCNSGDGTDQRVQSSMFMMVKVCISQLGWKSGKSVFLNFSMWINISVCL